MQENRGKDSRKRVFLEIDEIKKLVSLGMPLSEDFSYKWVWPVGFENLKELVPAEVSNMSEELPTYCFQELLQKLPLWIDMPAPKYLISCYHDHPVGKDKSGKDLYRHYLNVEVSVDGQLRVGYRNEYFDCVSPRYPFPECPKDPDDLYVVMTLPGGLIGEDWLDVVYNLFLKLLEDGLYYADFHNWQHLRDGGSSR